MIWTLDRLDPLVTIHPMSLEAVGDAFGPTNAGQWGGLVDTAWPAANRAIAYPFVLCAPITFTTLFAMLGATNSGNFDVGIYAADGTKIISAGATAMNAGASVPQLITVTSTTIGPGLYYCAMAVDNTTATLQNFQIGTVLTNVGLIGCGCAQMASAYVLPATFTFAQIAANYLPWCGVSTRSSI